MFSHRKSFLAIDSDSPLFRRQGKRREHTEGINRETRRSLFLKYNWQSRECSQFPAQSQDRGGRGK